MNELTPLTSKSGESEWPYDETTLIAVPEVNECSECHLYISCGHCTEWFDKNKLPLCVYDFDEPAIYIEKPATK